MRSSSPPAPRSRPRSVGGNDDGVGVHYVGTELREVVTCRPGATAYRVTRDGEQQLDARLLA